MLFSLSRTHSKSGCLFSYEYSRAAKDYLPNKGKNMELYQCASFVQFQFSHSVDGKSGLIPT